MRVNCLVYESTNCQYLQYEFDVHSTDFTTFDRQLVDLSRIALRALSRPLGLHLQFDCHSKGIVVAFTSLRRSPTAHSAFYAELLLV